MSIPSASSTPTVLSLSALTGGAAPAAQHPLDPITADEIAAAVSLVKAHPKCPTRITFVKVMLLEPEKASVLAFHHAPPHQKPQIDRQAFLVMYHRGSSSTYEAEVSLSRRQVLRLEAVPNVQPPYTLDEYEEIEKLTRQDPRVREVLRRRGITDPDTLKVDAWTVGFFSPDDDPCKRRCKPLLYIATHPDKAKGQNIYGRPVDGLEVTIDVDNMRILSVIETDQLPIPPYDAMAEYSPDFESVRQGFRKDVKPLDVVQPDGPSFTVTGNKVEWQNWSFHVGFNSWEGLTLHLIEYNDTDSGRVRPVLFRASVAEMVVPYGCPRVPNYRKNAFDAGEDGLGRSANPLHMGCNCLGHIQYFNAWMVSSEGQPELVENAVCLHEEDYGILWKHTNWRTDDTEVRRSRRLVISFISTIQNYEYGFFWYFYQDGGIQLEVKLTGILNTTAMATGVDPTADGSGVLIAPNLFAAIHQHWFTARLDPMVDGLKNNVFEVNSKPSPPGPKNPWNSAFYYEKTLLDTEEKAKRCVDPFTGRYWVISSTDTRNRMGTPCSFKLLPEGNTQFLAGPESSIYKRAEWLRHHLFVTPYTRNERYPAGDYPNQCPGGQGLVKYTAANRNIAATDVVVWYSFGTTHIPRTEDWPVMPVEYAGFKLKPANFFDRSPSATVPPSAAPRHVVMQAVDRPPSSSSAAAAPPCHKAPQSKL